MFGGRSGQQRWISQAPPKADGLGLTARRFQQSVPLGACSERHYSVTSTPASVASSTEAPVEYSDVSTLSDSVGA
jgi:hypothetical protein